MSVCVASMGSAFVSAVQLSDRLIRSADYLQEEIDGETVLVDAEVGNYFGLDEIGSEIWGALTQATLVSDLCATLAARFNTTAETVERDVLAFLSRLREHGLVTPA